jgi:zinc protease
LKKATIAAIFAIAISLGALAQPSPQDSKKPPATSSGAVDPTVDQILTRYLEAVGGRKAWKALHSRVSMGTIDVTSINLSGTVVVHEKAPDKSLTIIILAGSAYREAFDGKTGWAEDPADGLREETGLELAEAKRQADFYAPFDLRDQYSKLTFVGREKIGERESYVVEATLPAGSQPDRLYFDVDTGLLARLVAQHHAPEGVSQLQEDFSDYREIDGVKLPFTISQTSVESAFTIKINEVRHNVALGDGEFSKPAVQ